MASAKITVKMSKFQHDAIPMCVVWVFCLRVACVRAYLLYVFVCALVCMFVLCVSVHARVYVCVVC